ncbi:MAG: methyltransferase domain-containing protein [Alphaproteobacteria bacterium]|nr:methyltransferase domain-containing protein [Alphaproteobacteria bacterium]MBV8407522.1 methyltransferase domain-containing protein [Alphaproteobacteria bacterium]
MSGARQCYLCKGKSPSLLFQLDDLPISHYLRKSPDEPDPRFSVAFDMCRECGLLQILDPIPAHLIYGVTDTYTTGFQRPRHLEDLITTTVARQDPGRAIDIGCNDGALLEALRRAGYRDVVGVEPNPVAAQLARKKGFEVHGDYLTPALAARLAGEQAFDTVYLRHVVEHVSDLEAFFTAVRALLCDNGYLVMEIPDVEEAFALGSPAILWEEHVSYFTQPLAEYLLERFGFRVADRRRYVFGGGSMAFVAEKQPLPASCTVRRPHAAATLDLLQGFVARMDRQKHELCRLIAEARSAGYQVAVYGAAPRSCLVVSVSRVGDMIDFVVDDREDIHGRLMPGTKRAVQRLSEVTAEAGGKLLCLLGVGAENEFKVRSKVEATVKGDVAFVSLFPPRNTIESICAARRTIAAAGKG